MRGGGKLFMLAGVGLGLVAVLLAVMAFTAGGGSKPEPKAAKPAQVTVVETLRDVPAHTIITAEDVIEVNVSADGAPPDAVRSKAEVLGFAYRVPLIKGQRLVSTQIEQPGLANDIAAGKRAMALPVGHLNLFHGLVQDGDHVDVIFKARLNEVRLLGHVMGPTPEDEPYYKFESDDGFGWVPIDIVDEFPPFPAAGDPGSQMYIRDDVGDQQQLEPVAKLMLQDVRVLRVVRPGESFGADGQPVSAPVVEGASASPGEQLPSSLILEVSNQEAEVLAFMLDSREQNVYNVVIRGKDDHQLVSTTGVTYEILATNEEYGLPLPGTVTMASGVPATQNVVMPEDLEEGDYRAGEAPTLHEEVPADGEEPGQP